LSCTPDASNEAENKDLLLPCKEESERQHCQGSSWPVSDSVLEASAKSADDIFFMLRLKAPFTDAQTGDVARLGDVDPERDPAGEEKVVFDRSPSLAASPAVSRRSWECLKPALNPFHRFLIGEGVLDPPFLELPVAREDFWTCSEHSPRAVALGWSCTYIRYEATSASQCESLLVALACWLPAALLALRSFATAESFVICVDDGPENRCE